MTCIRVRLYFLQWLGSGEERLVATAQLKLLLSFTPFAVHTSAPALSAASDTSYQSSCSRRSSKDEALSGASKSPADSHDEPEATQESLDSRGVCHLKPEQTPEQHVHEQLQQSKEGHARKQQQQKLQSQASVQPSAEMVTDQPDRTSRDAHARPQEAAASALGEVTASTASGAEETSRRAELSSAPLNLGEIDALGLSPEQALSRLIQRAEQLRHLISATSAEGWPVKQHCAGVDTEHVQQGSTLVGHCVESSANPGMKPVQQGALSAARPLAVVASKPGGSKAGSLGQFSANASTVNGAQHVQQGHRSAPSTPNVAASKLQHTQAGSAEPDQVLHSASAASDMAKQKRVNDRDAPASKLRRVAEGNLGRGRTQNNWGDKILPSQVR